MSTTVLLVEDNEDLALGLRNNLEIEGYRVLTAHDGESALDQLGPAHPGREPTPDLVVLDLMLPGISGLHVLRRCRGAGYRGPILVLTARGEEADKVRALRLGADDYVTKPFGLLELLARVEALLRRAGGPLDRETLWLDDLEIRAAQREVRRRGVPIELTPKELDLLLALIEARGAVVTRHDLLTRVWGYREHTYSRTVDTHVAELRRKIEPDPAAPRYVLTVRKAGYRIAERALADEPASRPGE